MRRVAGEGVTLEPQLAEHAAELYAVISDPSLYAYIDQKEPVSEAALRERLAKLETRLSGDGSEDWLNWIVRNPAGELVGYVQATVNRAHNEAEIAYMLGKAYWRRGYAFAACRAMIAELQASCGVTHVTATLDPENTASLALLRKLGLRFDWEDGAAKEVGYAIDLNGVI